MFNSKEYKLNWIWDWNDNEPISSEQLKILDDKAISIISNVIKNGVRSGVTHGKMSANMFVDRDGNINEYLSTSQYLQDDFESENYKKIIYKGVFEIERGEKWII